MKSRQDTIAITVDKSHLITIGEQLYSRRVELIRELINNAYDADATEVWVEVKADRLVIKDNGLGMSHAGLKQYFNIGSPEKKARGKSRKYKRELIGQFGIGKFASLAAGSVFEVATQCDDFAARVIFDKAEWEKDSSKWLLPLHIYPPDPARGNGITVILSKIKKGLDPAEIENCIIESVPLRAPNFKVYLNGRRITSKWIAGHRIPFMEGTSFGPVHGEIVVLPSSQSNLSDLGIKCMVKQVLVKREFFGMESWGKEMSRVAGEVNADFLPITSDRAGFITDSEEYIAFDKVMHKVVKDVHAVMGKLSDQKDTKRARRALRDALQRVQDALRQNPEFSPFGILPVAEKEDELGKPGLVQPEKEEQPSEPEEIEDIGAPGGEDTEQEPDAEENAPEPTPKSKQPSLKKLTPRALVQRMKIEGAGVTCCLDHFGPDGPESFSEGTIIYINRDHPLYQREVKKLNSHVMHLARLLTQEISLMKDPQNPRQAYERQSKLLRTAFIDKS